MSACLDRVFDVADMRELARRRLPRGLFEFVDRGTDAELALCRNRAALDAHTLLPRILVDVSRRSSATQIFARDATMPVVIAPTGAAGLLWYRGEMALARAAALAGIPFTLATASITRLEDVAEQVGGRLWFQLYLWPERAMSMELVERARNAGYEALVVTADTVVTPGRSYNARNGFSVPMRANRRNIADLTGHPRWLLGVMGRYLLGGGMPKHENYPAALRLPITVGRVSNPKNETICWDDLREIRRVWQGPLLVKGILHPDDARQAVALGADGVIVSNHGGRNFDAAPAAIEVLPIIADAVGGRGVVMVDGGLDSGTDVAKAITLGADCVMMGRAPLWGVAVAGEAGVGHVLNLVRSGLDRCLAYMGVNSIDALAAGAAYR